MVYVNCDRREGWVSPVPNKLLLCDKFRLIEFPGVSETTDIFEYCRDEDLAPERGGAVWQILDGAVSFAGRLTSGC